jgi:glycosyl transferase family 25
MPFDKFERIRVINLRHRTDRRSEMEAQLARVGLLGDPRVAFHAASAADGKGLFSSRGAHGCFLSHYAVLKEAAEAGQSVLILEDDCDFLRGASTYALPEFDVFYGGYTASDPENPADSEIIGAHFMGYSARAAKAAAQYLADYLRPDFPLDPKAAAEPGFDPAIRPPFDGALVWFRRAHPELRTVFAILGVQRASRTDIGEQRWFDKIPGLRAIAGLARKAVRSLPAAIRPAAEGSAVFTSSDATRTGETR